MKSLAQRGALLFGVVFLLVGILGLFVDNGMSMDADMATAGRLFGLFPVNLLHNLVHLGFGVWGIVASRGKGASVTYGWLGGAVYGALVILAFVTPTLFGLVPIGGHDIWLHAVLALGLLGLAVSGRKGTGAATPV
ncbi:MAG: DUF4383 domain-containing protein [Gemmatimonadota bacterium]